MLDDGTIVKRGLKPDAKVFDELVFDVNTAYFENNGGYEYAKSFFEEAYKMAVNEIGGEQYVISAVMHADERNKALSEKLGRDVYHYHLHVVYVPVVEKEIYFKKNNKNPELAGKLKEVIPQISHSKKWPRRVPVDKNGKTVMLNSYSLLQDRFYDHMKAAGFEGFERGERGSTKEHLEVLDYKIQQDTIRAEEAAALAYAKEKQVAALNSQMNILNHRIEQNTIMAQTALGEVYERRVAAETLRKEIGVLNRQVELNTARADAAAADADKKEKKVELLDKKIGSRNEYIAKLDEKMEDRKFLVANIKEINNFGKKKNLVGQIVVTQSEVDYVKSFARDGVASRAEINDWRDKVNQLQDEVKQVERERDTWKHKYNDLMRQVGSFLNAVKHAPKRVMEFIRNVMREPPELPEPPEINKTKTKSRTEAR
jgi:hypothetical protein